MRVLLADDHLLFAEGLQNLLVSHGVEVVGIARDGLEALELAKRERPDVVLMDIAMPRCDGLAATRLIKAELPDVKIVVLTMSESDESLFEAVKSGASGYLLKSLKAAELVEMLSDLERGEVALSPGLGARLLEEFARLAEGAALPARATPAAPAATPATPPAGQAPYLTPRQQEVLRLVAGGMTYKEVGAALYISERTVKYHVRQILDLLHLENRAQVIAYAARMNMNTSGRGGGV